MNPTIGEEYNVPCLKVVERYNDREWNDWERQRKSYFIPIINHKHSDRENGQEYDHYHIDYRFVNGILPEDNITINAGRINLNRGDNYKIVYRKLKCITNINNNIAGAVKIDKLKHKCIYKGKCPHRGYPMSDEVPANGILKCPLHGLKFNSITKQIIK